jgi:hypothetical protein
MKFTLSLMTRADIRLAQEVVTRCHYLHRPVDYRTSLEGYLVNAEGLGDGVQHAAGILFFGRPEATRCTDWYGSVDDARSGRCEVTRWQVLNMSRVWLHYNFQPGGPLHRPGLVPGFYDRKGAFRSTLASHVLRLAIERIGFDYLMRRPPVFLDEPYEITWLMSYCDTRVHRGTIYTATGFERYRVNRDGIETWRIPLPSLTKQQHSSIHNESEHSERAQRYRAERLAEVTQ